jgi:hypothetical protein
MFSFLASLILVSAAYVFAEVPGAIDQLKVQAPSPPVAAMPVVWAETARPEPDTAPLKTLRWIYEANDPEILYGFFSRQVEFLKNNKALYTAVLITTYQHNDSIPMRELANKPNLSQEDRITLAIRYVNRSILRMGDLKGAGDLLERMGNDLEDLNFDWRAGYFYETLYSALAANSPAVLAARVKSSAGPSGYVKDPCAAALALLRRGYHLDERVIQGLLSKISGYDAYELMFYSDDAAFKLSYINEKLRQCLDKPYKTRRWAERELINILASFPEGRLRLEELKLSGHIVFLRVGAVYFGSVGDAVKLSELEAGVERLRFAARYMEQANDRFAGKGKVFYVDITPDTLDGEKSNPAGWGPCALYATHETVMVVAERAMAFSLLHEACELRSVKGLINSEFGLGYVTAGEDGYIEDLKLGRRIGGQYADSGLGHPWDSEREFFAETNSAVIIGETLPERAQPALAAAEKLLSRPGNQLAIKNPFP